MKNNKQQILKKSIEHFTWPNFIEEILAEDLGCLNIGNVLDLTEDKLKYGSLTKSEVVGLCNTLILIDSQLFYTSKLYAGLKNSKTFGELMKHLIQNGEVKTI